MRFRKKPVVIEAVQWTGSNVDEIIGFAFTKAEFRRKDHVRPDGSKLIGGSLLISTLEGDHEASPEDWIIKGIKGEFYPCKPDIFAATYEVAE